MPGRIEGVVLSNSHFQKTFCKLPNNIQLEAIRLIRELLFLDLDAVPAKLHLHHLKGKEVPSVHNKEKKVKVYTIHISANDSYKASFTLEGNIAYFRVCGTHDSLDKTP